MVLNSRTRFASWIALFLCVFAVLAGGCHSFQEARFNIPYGVDKNPLAVELCKVALWLEAHNPGEPLNFLDHHIKCG